MRKLMIMTFSMILLLLGCSQGAEDDIKSISVSKQKGVDEIIFDDRGSINIFQTMISSAVKEPGIVDVADPEYYLEIEFNNGDQQRFFLWVGEKGERSSLMKAEDTHTIYSVSKAKTDQLISLLEGEFDEGTK